MEPSTPQTPSSPKPAGRGFPRFLIVSAALVVGIVFGFLALAFILAGELYEYQDTFDGVHLPPVDAIVCLAGGRGRIAGAGDVWYRYRESGRGVPPPVLYLSGMGPQANWNVLLRQLRVGVRQVIRPENVVLETESVNTDANARWLSRYADQQGWSRVLLVTSPYHMKRARFIFEQVAQISHPLRIETLSIYQEPFEANEWRSNLHGIRVTMTEYLKWVYYRYFWRP